MRKIFLDCGANEGESVARFEKLFPDHREFEIFCFEPCEKSTAKINQSRITIINKAVWVKDGTVNFFEAGVSPAGSTLLKDKTTWNVSQTPIEVPSLDLSRWVSSNFTPANFIVMKMNIEGAEYKVLRKMLDDGALEMINRLYVSWHFRKIPSISKQRHKKLVDDIEAAGHRLLKWWD
jgi:FkbM family methyltransferase